MRARVDDHPSRMRAHSRIRARAHPSDASPPSNERTRIHPSIHIHIHLVVVLVASSLVVVVAPLVASLSRRPDPARARPRAPRALEFLRIPYTHTLQYVPSVLYNSLSLPHHAHPLTLPPETHTRDHRAPITRFSHLDRRRSRRLAIASVASSSSSSSSSSRATATRLATEDLVERWSRRVHRLRVRSRRERQRERETRERDARRDGSPDDDRPRARVGPIRGAHRVRR